MFFESRIEFFGDVYMEVIGVTPKLKNFLETTKVSFTSVLKTDGKTHLWQFRTMSLYNHFASSEVKLLCKLQIVFQEFLHQIKDSL